MAPPGSLSIVEWIRSTVVGGEARGGRQALGDSAGLTEVVGLEIGDLEVDRGADGLDLRGQVGVTGRNQVGLDLTEMRGRPGEATESTRVRHASRAAGKTRAVS